MASKSTVIQVLVILGAAYPDRKIDENTGKVYGKLLSDIPDGALVLAAEHHAASSKWFPKISELREAAFAIRAKASG